MDVYIKQVDCPEVQGHKWAFGDTVVFKSEVDILENDWSEIVLGAHNFNEWDYYRSYHGLFIPRQEDIQEMLRPEDIVRLVPYTFIDTHPDWNKMKALWLWFEQQPPDYQEILMSLESVQFWLAFYMQVIHNKRWTAEGWV